MNDDGDKLAEFIHGLTFKDYAKLFLKIEDTDRNLIPFNLNEAQLIVYDEIVKQEKENRPIRILILKGRQQGMSTLSQGWLSWKVLTEPRTRALTVGHKLSAVHDIFDKFKVMLDHLPDELKPSIDQWKTGRRCSFSEPMRGQLRYDSAERPDDVGRAGTFQHLHLTEIPQWANPELSMQAVLACVPDSVESTIIVESTAKGKSNWFYDTWMDSIRKVRRGEDPEFYPCFVPWFKTQRYAREKRKGETGLEPFEKSFKEKYGLTNEQCFWYRDQRIKYGNRVVEEFPSTWEEAFLSSGLPFFRAETLQVYKKMRRMPLRKGMFRAKGRGPKTRIAFEDDSFGPTWIFEEPDKSRRYSVGVDFASGRAKDFSAIHVIDADSKAVVATHKSKLLPDDVLMEAFFLGTIFNKAVIVPERTGIGQALVDRLVNDLKYSPVYRSEDKAVLGNKKGRRFGWNTSAGSRGAMLEDLSHLIHCEEIRLPCGRTFEEMETFVFTDDEGKRAEADGSNNDDMIMSLAMAIQGFKQSQFNIDNFETHNSGIKPRISSRIGY